MSGMSNMEQLEDNVGYMENFKPLSQEEQEVIKRSADIIRSAIAVPCTGCSYCTDGCPMKIAIPQYFSLYNEDMRESKDKGWTANQSFYKHLTETSGKAGDCIGCGQCEAMCPQHLPVISHLKAVSEYYDK